MNNNSFLGILIFIISVFIVVTLIRVLWPFVLIFIVYVVIRSFFMKKPKVNYRETYSDYNGSTQQTKQDSNVIDVDFEERELKDHEN
ncbi:MAG: hypothetical protein GXY98_06545 [Erysipelothrix sp.]|nr:hypothetical protein [Erysipelothrix sp.]